MTINCNNLNFGLDYYVPSSINEQNRLKSSKLVKELIDINEELEHKRNYMIIPMNVFNLLELHDKFENCNLFESIIPNGDNLYLVGRIYNFDCYLDLHMMSDTILLHYDKQSMRDVKIESILNDKNLDSDAIKIDVIL